MKCRPNCGACCIAPSISSSLPGMPNGKPAGKFCANLEPKTLACRIWGTDNYPKVCKEFMPSDESCRDSAQEAMISLTFFENATAPDQAT